MKQNSILIFWEICIFIRKVLHSKKNKYCKLILNVKLFCGVFKIKGLILKNEFAAL